MTNLTEKELTVLIAMAFTSFDVAGGTFGFTDEIPVPHNVRGHHGLSSLIGLLSRKGMLSLWPDEKVNGEVLGTTQYSLTDRGWEAIGGWGAIHEAWDILQKIMHSTD